MSLGSQGYRRSFECRQNRKFQVQTVQFLLRYTRCKYRLRTQSKVVNLLAPMIIGQTRPRIGDPLVEVQRWFRAIANGQYLESREYSQGLEPVKKRHHLQKYALH